MKKIISLLILGLIISLAAFAFEGGGVDVGTSNQKGNFSLREFKTNSEMVKYVQNLIPRIEKGKLKEVRTLTRRGKCSNESVKFDELSEHPYYRYNNKTGILEKEFEGSVSVLLKDCKRPGKLK